MRIHNRNPSSLRSSVQMSMFISMFLVFPASGRGAPCYHDYNIPTSRRHVNRGSQAAARAGKSHPLCSDYDWDCRCYRLPTTTLTLARLILILFCHTDLKPRPSGRHTVEDSLREEFDVDTKRQRLTSIITFGYVMIVSSMLGSD